MARERSTARNAAAFLAVVCAVAAVVLVVWQLWPEISWSTGLVDEEWPYHSEAAEPGTPSPGGGMPEGRRLVIPSIAVDVPILQGRPEDALRAGVYHHPETGDPGDQDSIVFGGHRNRRVLALLSRLRPGDPVLVYWDGNEHVYRVSRTFVVSPTDPTVLAPADHEELRVYTCLPRYLGNKRTVVIALPEG